MKIDDPQYVFIHTAAAVTSGDRLEAEKILRELFAKRPDDQQVRLVLAEQFARNPEKRAEGLAEALEILDRPFAPTGLIGPKAYLVREFQIGTLVMATNLRLDTYAAAADAEQRKKLQPQIEDGLAKLASKDADSPRTLRLTGKWLLIQGKTKEAVQTLEKARQLAEKGNLAEQGDSQATRWETVDLLARAYVETGQTGRAKAMLTELVNRWESHEAVRMALVRLLLREGDTENARPHVEWFTRNKPNDPDVIRLILLKGVDPKTPAKEKEEVEKAYTRLPETNKQQMLDKVQVAMATSRQDDALSPARIAPDQGSRRRRGRRDGIPRLSRAGELDKAREAIASALKVNPDSERLQLIQKQVADMTPKALNELRRQEAAKITDPLKREMTLAGIERSEGNDEAELNHLLAAQKDNPNEIEVTYHLFNYHLRKQQWDQAEKLLEPLARADQDQAGGLLLRYRLALARGDYEAATKYARNVVQNMPEFGQSWIALGAVLQITGQTDEALSKYLAALERISSSPEAFRGIIDCYYAMGRPAEAKSYIDRARRALPQNQQFQELEINHDMAFGDPSKAIAPREEAR